jgi:hypothetical protein
VLHPAATGVAAGPNVTVLGGGSGCRGSALGLVASGTESDDLPGHVAALKRRVEPGSGIEFPVFEAVAR